jgi:hypothetical protein
MRLRSLCLSLLLLSVVAGDAMFDGNKAHAEARLVVKQPRTDRQIELNIRGSAYYGYGFYDNYYGYSVGGYAAGVGVQLLFPIVKNAISTLNNPMYLGLFTDFLFHPVVGGTLLSLTIGPVFQWRFVLLDLFETGGLSVFANIGFGIWPWFLRDYYGGGVNVYGFPLFQIGSNLQFTRRVGLTLNLGYPSVNLGLNLAF